MSGENHPIATGIICLSLSLAVNGAAFVSFDRALVSNALQAERLQKKALQQAEKDKLRFEFIEAPPKTRLEKPESPAKISSRDAVNQDAQGATPLQPGAPKIQELGPSDQLAQQRGEGIVPLPENPSSNSEPAQRVTPPPQNVDGSVPPRRAEKGSGSTSSPSRAKSRDSLSPAAPSDDGARNERVPQAAGPAGPVHDGRDKITTQEMTKTTSFGAQFKGDISFEATGSGMGEYMKNLKERIWLAWFPPIAFKYPSEFRGADAVIQFTLDREGKVIILRVAEDGGNRLFAAYCMESVQRATDFGPLPEEILAILGREDLEISFTFHYR